MILLSMFMVAFLRGISAAPPGKNSNIIGENRDWKGEGKK